MPDGDRLVPRSSPEYREFARLHDLARTLRGSTVDQWSGDLYAIEPGQWGGFNPKTGAIRLADDRVLKYLTGSTAPTDGYRQAQAIATVLHESTHAGMHTDAPDEPNAVRSDHSLGLMEGVAELRTVEDFAVFSPNLFRGPGAMHFDQFADGVVRNRLSEVVPDRAEHRQAVRAALIPALQHAYWPTIRSRPLDAGEHMADEIRQHLNAKVDEIRRHYVLNPRQTFPAEPPNPSTRTPVQAPGGSRFLAGQAPASGAARVRPSLGDGARGVSSSIGPGARAVPARPPTGRPGRD